MKYNECALKGQGATDEKEGFGRPRIFPHQLTWQRRLLFPVIVLTFILSLVVSMVLPTHAARPGGMGTMGSRGGMMINSAEERAAEVAEKLWLSEAQQVQVVYLLEYMFRQQFAYSKQARESDELSRTEGMENMKVLREKTMDQNQYVVAHSLPEHALSSVSFLKDESPPSPASASRASTSVKSTSHHHWGLRYKRTPLDIYRNRRLQRPANVHNETTHH